MHPVVEEAWRAKVKKGKKAKSKEPDEYDDPDEPAAAKPPKSKGVPRCPSPRPSYTDRKIIPCDPQCVGNRAAPDKKSKRDTIVDGFTCFKSPRCKKVTMKTICASAGGHLCACCQALLECFTAFVKLICCSSPKCYDRGFCEITCQIIKATCCLGQDFCNLIKYLLCCVTGNKCKI